MLTEIKSHVEAVGHVSIRRFLIDFELPVIKEIQIVFGRDITISGCYVHFRRNLRKNLRKQKHLQTLSLKNSRFYAFISGLVALVYIPEAEVVEYYNALLEEELGEVYNSIRASGQGEDDDFVDLDDIKKSIAAFLQYVEKTYIGQPGRLGSWTPPRFPISSGISTTQPWPWSPPQRMPMRHSILGSAKWSGRTQCSGLSSMTSRTLRQG
jgi:hypothetical protein